MEYMQRMWTGLDGAGTGVTVAWGLDPESTGDYLFRIRVANQVWYRWVSVDLDPPSISGALLVSNSTVTLSNPVTASDGSAVLHLRYMLVQLTFSEPVREFDLAATLKLDGGAKFITAECFSSKDAAAKIAAAAAAVVAAPTVEAAAAPPTDVSPPPPPPPSNLLETGIVQDTTSTAAVVSRDAQQYIRSCLAVLYAREGSEPSVSLQEGAVNDVAGNPNDTPLLLRTKLPDTVRVDLIRASRIGSFLVGGVLSTSALTRASASLTWAVYRSSSMLQSTYHIQVG
ncbi:hypothetical protein PLESTB_001562500 [Pleodorina starrii]|uniref:Uncharacterized protein n=1 Tax=Pleodorina starrii TaxID=330485 RepID=A0A9W6F8W5_9CHLO|nr:hypothetical protein PLESTB_001562500 [Pleodorina starrii]